MSADLPERDERTVAVENESYRWACVFLTYALLVDVVVRGLVRREAAWDLLALVVLSGGLATVHQARRRILTRRWVRMAVLAACIAGAIAVLLALAVARR